VWRRPGSAALGPALSRDEAAVGSLRPGPAQVSAAEHPRAPGPSQPAAPGLRADRSKGQPAFKCVSKHFVILLLPK
jgi:hypothetical protein